jgi:diketogulonate reductase-like aldo/keto reductase
MTRRHALRVLGTSAAALACGFRPSFAATPAPIGSRKIPATGESLPVIGLGTWQTFDRASSPGALRPVEEVLSTFVELGGRVIDSSPMYGRAEEVVGDLSAKFDLREKLFIATKVWTTGRRAGIEQMKQSMRKLRAPRIDLMQVHNLVDVGTHLETLREWKRDGLVRYIGVTHYTPDGQEAIADLIASQTIDFIQINYSVEEREAERRLLPLAHERGIGVIVNRPFAGGSSLRRLRSTPLPDWAAEIDCTSWAQLSLKFIIAHPAVTCAIPATSKVAHLRDNMRAGIGPLPDESLRARIVAALAA